jgi:2-keto-4-pentenoate hydratase/2-oxohepta-3-ene-1,7-dioic acid hydratase in catechol pathway
MRLVTFSTELLGLRLGCLVDDDEVVIDLAAADRALFGQPSHALTGMQALIEGGEAGLEHARKVAARAPAGTRLARTRVVLAAPLHPPAQMRDCSCFELHLRQAFAAARKYRARAVADAEAACAVLADTNEEDRVIETFRRQPIYYKANRFSVIGTDQDVIWPTYSRAMDFELEWGCYIGKRTRDASAGDARASIFGYTIFNDFSARDAQALEMPGQLGPAKGKDFDGGNAMGPCLVTVDEISDPYCLTMIARVNGEEWTRGTTADMYWRFEDVIAHISQSETLYPGEFLGSGTVGNGCGLEHMRSLRSGDEVELEVEHIGVLRNRVLRSS